MSSDSAAVISFYDSIGIQYEKAFGHDEGLLKFIRSSLKLLPHSASVLDIGCGTGKPTSAMVSASSHKLYGIDFSPVMIELSEKQVPNGVFELVDMRQFSPQSSFDAMFATFSLFHLSREELTALTKSWPRWVLPGGYLFIGTMVADDFDCESGQFDEDGLFAHKIEHTFMGKRGHNSLFTKKGWEMMLADAGFEIVRTEMVSFQAPPEAECAVEPHYYITARKTAF